MMPSKKILFFSVLFFFSYAEKIFGQTIGTTTSTFCSATSINFYTQGDGTCGNANVLSQSGWMISPAPSSITYNYNGQGYNSVSVTWNSATSNVSVRASYTCSANGSGGTLTYPTFNVNAPVTPSVTLTTNNPSICQGGGNVILTASPTNGGTAPYYSFYVDGVSVYSGTSTTYTYNTSSLAAGSHSAYVTLTSNACTTPSPSATSSTQNFSVTGRFSYTVMVNGPGQICSANNTNVYFVATVATPPPSGTLNYQWYLNGSAVGSNSINNDYTFSTLNNGNTVYCKVSSDYWCTNSPIQSTNTYTVTLTPSTTPTLAIQVPKLNYCSGENISFTSNLGASTYSWRLSGNLISTLSTTSLAVSSDVNAPNAFSPGDIVTLDVTGITGNCLTQTNGNASTSTIPIVVYTLPIVQASNPSICSGTAPSIALTTSNNVSGTSFTWSVVQDAQITGGSSGSGSTIAQTLSNSDILNRIATYTIVPTANGCVGPSGTAVVTVKPVPVINNLPTTIASCANATTSSAISFTPTTALTGTTYAWSNSITGSITGATPTSGSGGISQTVFNSGAAAGSVVYTFTPTNNGCVGTAKAYTATINPKPTLGGLSNPSICSGQAASFTLTSQATGTTYTWTQTPSLVSGSSNGSGATISQTLTNTDGLNNGSVIYNVTGTAGACTGTASATVTVKPLPAFNPNPPAASIWTNGTASYTPVFTITSSYNWTSSISGTVTGATASGSTPISNVLLNAGASPGTVTYAISPVSSGGCAGISKNFVVTVTPNPIIVVTGAPNGRIALSKATLDVGTGYTSYSWTNSASTQVAISQTYLTSSPDTYSVTVAKAGITGFGTASVLINPEFYGLVENYIVTNSVLVGNITTENGITPLTVDQLNQTVQYFDGLGRPSQTVNTLGSPSKLDLVQPMAYDAFGREYRKYLPISMESNGRPKTGLIDGAGNFTTSFYNNATDKIADDTTPFAETVFEPSPLNRVIKQGSAGTAWQPANPGGDIYSNADKTVKKRYQMNVANEVRLFKYDATTGLITPSVTYFVANQLYANLSYDEHNNEVWEYTDKQGRVVCKKVYVETISTVKQYACTYYVYDDFGNLAVVLPPEATKLF